MSSLFLLVSLALALIAAVGIAVAVARANRGRAVTGREGMIGEVGTVRRPVAASKEGMVFVHGELWRALPEDPAAAPMEPGTEVEIVGFRRAKVVVRPAGKTVS